MTYDGRGGGADWAGYQPEQQRGISGPMTAFIALLAVLVLALLGVAAYLFLRPGGSSGDGRAQGVVASSSSSTTAAQPPQSPVTETAFTTPPQRETVTVTREAPAPRPTSSAPYPSGADYSGWLDNRQARCNAGDPAAMIGRTTQASFSICINPDNGRYYYRGSAGGSGVEVDDPVVAGDSATVTNNGVVYSISPAGMVIYEDGAVISDQPMVSFWAD